MSQKQRVEYVDDLDGSPATVTKFFAVNGKGYAVDLNDKNAAAFDKAMEVWTVPAQKSPTPLRRPVSLVKDEPPAPVVPPAPAPELPKLPQRRVGRPRGSANKKPALSVAG